MALELAERRDVDFVLYEQLGLDELIKHERFAAFNKKTLDLIITEARRLAVKELLPANGPGDKEGCTFSGGTVKVPEAYRRIFELYREEQDLTENIIHPVLARTKGAPEGTKGISLFLVPKIRVNADGSLGESNDVVCTGIEEKLGIHGSATCSLTLGGKGRCIGTLLGEENKGMMVMFHMMNEARLGAGIQGFAMASAAYAYALSYARERKQGRNLMQMMNPEAPSVPIIQHPDVRQMLMWMKAYVEGMRSFVYYLGSCFDRVALAGDHVDRDRWQGLIELLTPVVKAYCSDKAFEVCTQAVQIYGGYGYIMEYPVEQYLRDAKITSIYEGTNGIQAMDFLGRKLGMKQGKYFMELLGEMRKTVATARQAETLKGIAVKLEKAVSRLGETALTFGATAMSPKVMTAFAFAQPLLEATGDVIMGWMHLWRAVAAVPGLEKHAGSLDPATRMKRVEKNKHAAFYEGKLRTAEFFIHTLLPAANGKMDAINSTCDAAAEMPERSFWL